MSDASEADGQALARATISRGISGEDRYRLTVQGWEHDLQQARSILDVGCGEGHFGSFIRRTLGWKGRLVGTDIHKYEGVSSDIYDQWHGWNMNQLTGLIEERFDVIFICEALHCVESPRFTVRSLTQCLNARGRLVFTTANPLSLASLATLIFRGMFRDFQAHPQGWRYPTQLTPILPVDAGRICTECGLTDVSIAYSNRFRVPGTRLTLQSLIPFAGGRWFSDCYRALARLPAVCKEMK
jgi:SAM-dependent methyltransferase